MRSRFLALVLALIGAGALTAAGASAQIDTSPAAAASALTVSIQVHSDSLKSRIAHEVSHGVDLDTSIRNRSDRVQKITLWTNEGWSWISTVPEI